MLVISVSMNGGIKTVAHVEGDWRIERVGWGGWTATHLPSGTVIATETTDLDAARRVARERVPDAVPSTLSARYTIEPRFNRRFGQHRKGETR